MKTTWLASYLGSENFDRWRTVYLFELRPDTLLGRWAEDSLSDVVAFLLERCRSGSPPPIQTEHDLVSYLRTAVRRRAIRYAAAASRASDVDVEKIPSPPLPSAKIREILEVLDGTHKPDAEMRKYFTDAHLALLRGVVAGRDNAELAAQLNLKSRATFYRLRDAALNKLAAYIDAMT